MHAILSVLLLATSALAPTKMWFAPDQPITINVKPGGEAQLVLTNFKGKILDPKAPTDLAADKTVNLRDFYREMDTPGSYVLYVVKKGAAKDLSGAPTDFIGTPLVVNIRQDTRRGGPGGVMVTRVEPLRYAVMNTAAGPITMAFYFDVAPNTASSFLRLSEEGFYDGLTFHRILPGFVLQGGDPRGDGSGGPGYTINAEFSDRPHKEGALSMARMGDPEENAGQPPRPQFADSASSQFFVCLDYNGTRALDNKYTVFGEVTSGMDAVKKIAATPLSDPRAGTPQTKQVIDKVEVKLVTSAENPYATIFKPAAVETTTPAPAPK
jgi:cyclophilin family peptidyl-prolyl cis-trans isomerase